MRDPDLLGHARTLPDKRISRGSVRGDQIARHFHDLSVPMLIVAAKLPFFQQFRHPAEAGWLVEGGGYKLSEAASRDPLLDLRCCLLRCDPPVSGGRVIGTKGAACRSTFPHGLLQFRVECPGTGVSPGAPRDVTPGRCEDDLLQAVRLFLNRARGRVLSFHRGQCLLTLCLECGSICFPEAPTSSSAPD